MPHANRSKKKNAPGRNPKPEEIRAAREAARLSQTEAAELCFSTLRSWQNWEAGEAAGGSRMHPAIWAYWKSQVNGLPDDVREVLNATRSYIELTLPFANGLIWRQKAAELTKLIEEIDPEDP